MPKTVLILSGGLDSTTLLYWLLNRGDQVKALSFNYGQRHKKELQAAEAIAKINEIEHHVIDLFSINKLLKGSSQTDWSVQVPYGHYAQESMKKTVVANRNSIMLNIAAAWAISLEYDKIAYAAHAGDHAIYPDCRTEFVRALELALQEGNWHKIKIEAPFLHATKADIVETAAKLGVPFALTWSCYEGGEIHCGQCGTCQEKAWAFDKAGVVDPTAYLDRDAYKRTPVPGIVK